MRNTKPKKTKPLIADQRFTDSIDYVVPKRTCFQPKRASLLDFDDNDAVIKIIKGRSASMRHISRTHSVNLEWLFDG